jgi:hypothetical protein
VIKIEKTLSQIELNASDKGILGRAVVLHEVSSSEGLESGTRVGAGVIGISKDGLKNRSTGYNAKGDPRDSRLGTTPGSASNSSPTRTSSGAGDRDRESANHSNRTGDRGATRNQD